MVTVVIKLFDLWYGISVTDINTQLVEWDKIDVKFDMTHSGESIYGVYFSTHFILFRSR